MYAESSTVPPEVTAHAYLVMDAQTGQGARTEGRRRAELSSQYHEDYDAGAGYGKMRRRHDAAGHGQPGRGLFAGGGLVPCRAAAGEVVSLNDLFHATILASANDAANVLAEYTAGSMEAFVELMNAKAAELGLAGTHFVNANGLHSADHYTTPYDMARLTQWAMTVPAFPSCSAQRPIPCSPPTSRSRSVCLAPITACW